MDQEKKNDLASHAGYVLTETLIAVTILVLVIGFTLSVSSGILRRQNATMERVSQIREAQSIEARACREVMRTLGKKCKSQQIAPQKN